MREAGLPEPTREYEAVLGRKFRFDFAWPKSWLLVEIHGGLFRGGRHGNAAGFTKDREKMNLAQLEGYRVLEFPSHILRTSSGYVLHCLKVGLLCP